MSVSASVHFTFQPKSMLHSFPENKRRMLLRETITTNLFPTEIYGNAFLFILLSYLRLLHQNSTETTNICGKITEIWYQTIFLYGLGPVGIIFRYSNGYL